MSNFNAKEAKEKCVKWIKDWFNVNGKGCNAVVGVSGGKDSSIVAALCVEALGNERVIGVLMPDGDQSDIVDGIKLAHCLKIKWFMANIGDAVCDVKESIERDIKGVFGKDLSEQTIINLPPRIRMATLYAISQSLNGRVANTCNLSEDWIGYSTRYGDSVGDFSPLSNFTVEEVLKIGFELSLPEELVSKPPADGLCGLTDEDKIGFSYKVLDRYIRTGVCEDTEIKEKIDEMHNKNLFKLKLMDSFKPNIEELYDD